MYKRTVLISGFDGYCGWPLTLKLMKNFPSWHIIGIDNLARRNWVKEVESESVIPIADVHKRVKKAYEIFKSKFEYKIKNLTYTYSVYDLLKEHKPDVILHLASQPSAPFSEIDVDHCNYTQHNNTTMLRNLIWGIKDLDLHTHLVVTTTTGIYGAPDFDIPEGNLVVNKMELPFPSMGGSWYHQSRAMDSDNLWLAARQFSFPISEFRTAIVCGSSTEETRLDPLLATRFDTDFHFGVVLNRFIMQALQGEPITIYGKGLQGKPMVSLEAMCESLLEPCREIAKIEKIEDLKYVKQYRIYNQMEKAVSIVDLAKGIKSSFKKEFDLDVKIEHIPNPRVENEEHRMKMNNKEFKKLIGGRFKHTIDVAIKQMCRDLISYRGKDVK